MRTKPGAQESHIAILYHGEDKASRLVVLVLGAHPSDAGRPQPVADLRAVSIDEVCVHQKGCASAHLVRDVSRVSVRPEGERREAGVAVPEGGKHDDRRFLQSRRDRMSKQVRTIAHICKSLCIQRGDPRLAAWEAMKGPNASLTAWRRHIGGALYLPSTNEII